MFVEVAQVGRGGADHTWPAAGQSINVNGFLKKATSCDATLCLPFLCSPRTPSVCIPPCTPFALPCLPFTLCCLTSLLLLHTSHPHLLRSHAHHSSLPLTPHTPLFFLVHCNTPVFFCRLLTGVLLLSLAPSQRSAGKKVCMYVCVY